MSLSANAVAPYARLIAVITLGHGLMDCARLLGLGAAVSPVMTYGPQTFWSLTAFVLMRLFAWGAVLVIAANGGELLFSLFAPQLVGIGIVGFAIRLLMLFATTLLIVFERYLARMHANEL